MESVHEVCIISDSGNSGVNCSMYDLKSGTVIDSFKEGNSIRNGVAFIGNDYLISAFKNKPILKVWTLQRSSREECLMTSPGLVSSLAVSNCGTYCIAGIGTELYIWEVSSGNIQALLQYHAQDISCVRFTTDGSHFISGGKDGIVHVWLLYEALTVNEGNDYRPRFSWMDHVAEVTDIFVGSLGLYARVATASKDMTCKIYELETGYPLTTVRVDFAITAVTMDACEYFLILGSADGNIFRVNLFSTSDSEVHYENVERKRSFLGHSNEITCLSVSSNGQFLISGSADKDVRIWDMTNFSCIRTIACSGPVTNAFCTLLPPSLKNEKHKPSLTISTFKRTNYLDEEDDGEFVVTKLEKKKLSLLHLGAPDEFFDSRILNCSSESLETMVRGKLSVEDMSRVNSSMYAFTLGDTIYEDNSENDDSDSSD